MKSAYIEITNKCNFFCKHCQNDSRNNSTAYFSKNKIIEMVDVLMNAGVKTINITGGEPTIHPEFGIILSELLKRDINVNVLTNGYLIDRYINIFKQYRSNIFVQISLDGYDVNSFYEIRNNYKFNSILNNIKLLRKNNINVRLKTTLTKSNFIYYDKFLNISRELDCPLKFNFLNPIGRGNYMRKECLALNDIEQFSEKLKSKNMSELAPTLDQFFVKKCSILNDEFNVIKISSNGLVYPCIGFRGEEFSLGNVNYDSLEKIINNIKFLRDNIIEKINNKNCNECMGRDLCNKQCLLICSYLEKVKK